MTREQRRGLKGTFWEKSNSANSYRAEQLDVCAVHHLITALISFYKIILRNIRNTRNRTTATIKYDHVYGHMEKYLLIIEMTLEQQMNFVCDKEASKAVERSIRHKIFTREKQLLPREDAAVFVRDKKLTSGLSRAIRLEASREKANLDQRVQVIIRII